MLQKSSINCPNQFTSKYLPTPIGKVYNDFWKLNWDEFIVGCDTHVPYFNKFIFEKMLRMAEKYKIKNFIHAGDFWNQDMFSRFDVSREDLIPWNEEIKVGKGIIQSLKSVFKNVYFFLGSHDLRVWLMLLRQGKDQPFDMAWRMTEEKGINVSQYRYAEIGTEWRINHPKNVVKVGGLPSVRLSAKHNRSIIFGHGHWWGINRDPSGKHYLVAPGCLVDKERISYRSLWDTSHDEWVNGFCMIVDKNKPILFSSDSPWKMYLK